MMVVDNLKRIAGNSGEIAPIDGLRAFAIIFVLLRHIVKAYSEEFPNIFSQIEHNPAVVFMLNGWAGVDLFFVLSGFLIGFHLLKNWPEKGSSKLTFILKYWGKRILRTFPLYYATLLIVYFSLIPLYEHSSTDLNSDIKVHMLFLQDYFGATILVPLWSLATEEKFYFFCPFLIWLSVIASNRWTYSGLIIIFLLSLIPLYNRIDLLSYYSVKNYSEFFWNVRAPFHLALDGLLLGLLLAFFYHKQYFVQIFTRFNKFIFLLALAFFIILMTTKDWMNVNEYWEGTAIVLFVLAILFSILLYSSIFSKAIIRKVMSSSPLRFISKLSYSLYLSHMLVIPLSLFFSSYVYAGTTSQVLYIISLFLVYMTLSFSLSIILHISIERPFLHLKNKIHF